MVHRAEVHRRRAGGRVEAGKGGCVHSAFTIWGWEKKVRGKGMGKREEGQRRVTLLAECLQN